MSRLEWAKEFFKNDRYATQTTGISIISAEGDYAKCELEIKDAHLNSLNSVMGGAIFTLADFCFAVASNTESQKTTSLTSEISFMNRAKGNTLIAEAICLKKGRTTSFYTIRIYDNTGIHVANVNTTGYLFNNAI